MGRVDDQWPNVSADKDGDGNGPTGHTSPGAASTSSRVQRAKSRATAGTRAAMQWITLAPPKFVAVGNTNANKRRETRHCRRRQGSFRRRILPARLSPVLLSPAVVNVAHDVGDTLPASGGATCQQARAREKLYRLTSYWMCRFGDYWQLARDMCCHLMELYDGCRAWRDLRMLTTLADRDMDNEAPNGQRELHFWRDYGPRQWSLAEHLDRTVSYLEK